MTVTLDQNRNILEVFILKVVLQISGRVRKGEGGDNFLHLKKNRNGNNFISISTNDIIEKIKLKKF